MKYIVTSNMLTVYMKKRTWTYEWNINRFLIQLQKLFRQDFRSQSLIHLKSRLWMSSRSIVIQICQIAHPCLRSLLSRTTTQVTIQIFVKMFKLSSFYSALISVNLCPQKCWQFSSSGNTVLWYELHTYKWTQCHSSFRNLHFK